jgi:hypothetical protein
VVLNFGCENQVIFSECIEINVHTKVSISCSDRAGLNLLRNEERKTCPNVYRVENWIAPDRGMGR